MLSQKYNSNFSVTSNLFVFGLIFAIHSTTCTKDAVASESEDIHIRTLAASCAACHGTLGNPTTSQFSIQQKTLAGMPANEFESKIKAFKTGEKKSTVMHHHAKGLNENEIKLLGRYFSNLNIKDNQLPPQQKLEASHD